MAKHEHIPAHMLGIRVHFGQPVDRGIEISRCNPSFDFVNRIELRRGVDWR